MRVIVAVFVVLWLASCGESIEEFDGFIAPEIQHLLSHDSSKVWVKTETRLNSELQEHGCDDSLAYIFTTFEVSDFEGNALYVIFDPSNCTRDQFCLRYPMICRGQELLCADTTINCDSLPVNLFFAGTWEVVEPEIENGTTDNFIINFPEDTTQYSIRFITSQNLEMVHTEGEDEVFEKFRFLE